MKIVFNQTESLDECKNLLTGLVADENIKGVLVLGCDQNNWNIEQANSLFKSIQLPVFGGIFPQIVYGHKNYLKGFILVGLQHRPEVFLINNISGPAESIDESISEMAGKINESNTNTPDSVFVFVDGLTKGINKLIESLFLNLGMNRTIAGGGGGSLSFNQKPCVISNEGLTMDSAVIARVPFRSASGVTHGWTSVTGTIEVTQSTENVVESLDWKPAAEVYRELIEKHSGKKFAENKFFDLAKSYPLGISRLDEEYIVRDPIAEEGNKIICIADVPKGSFVHLLHGDAESLIKSASQASKAALKALCSESGDHLFVVNCISRVLYLEDKSSSELEAISANKNLFGVLSLGEIANNGEDFLEFYNKTTVVVAFEKY